MRSLVLLALFTTQAYATDLNLPGKLARLAVSSAVFTPDSVSLVSGEGQCVVSVYLLKARGIDPISFMRMATDSSSTAEIFCEGQRSESDPSVVQAFDVPRVVMKMRTHLD